MILAFGLFDVALGGAYVVQPRLRGQGIFFLVAGMLLTLSSLALKRQARRRAEAATKKPTPRQWRSRSSAGRVAPARGRSAKVAPPRARGPKAGSKSRLAGPSRYKAEATPEPRRLFRKKDEPRPDAPRKPGGRKGDVG